MWGQRVGDGPGRSVASTEQLDAAIRMHLAYVTRCAHSTMLGRLRCSSFVSPDSATEPKMM